ncbi:IclR family transcriptional regulator [Streptomyces anulatus]|uniref:IclR family transcriptional regulator n=1 Tax=Streptomyces anulatus TaxID=1892 RepID=UPI00224DBB46|nr:IclR family transcriptional regulator [Streptomyces anulatus]MCX4505906.1 IclR family transcriptional regulator [Streptomyces anulatus]
MVNEQGPEPTETPSPSDASAAGTAGKRTPPASTVQIVDHALLVLKTIAEADRPRGLRELSRDLEISKSSTQRILASLERVGLAVVDENSRKYVIGPAALTLAWRHAANSDLVSAASEATARIAASTGETACVSAVVDGRRVTVYEVESSQPLRLITGVGRPYSLFSGATGRVLLSMLPEAHLEHLVGEHVSATGATDAAEIADRVATARDRGYAFSRGEWIMGGCGVAVPIATQGTVTAALSIYGPEARLADQRMADLVPLLQSAAAQIAIRWRQPS